MDPSAVLICSSEISSSDREWPLKHRVGSGKGVVQQNDSTGAGTGTEGLAGSRTGAAEPGQARAQRCFVLCAAGAGAVYAPFLLRIAAPNCCSELAAGEKTGGTQRQRRRRGGGAGA